MNFNFKYYGKYDVSILKSLIENNNLDWDDYVFRQTHRKGQQETKTIPLIWSEDFTEFKTWENYNTFKDEILKIESLFNELIGNGKITTALLINLPKYKKILPHTDSGSEHFFKNNRLHIPIVTNDNCWFHVSDETKQMKKGEIWEINNSNKVHSVDNDGDSDRIHLLVDFLPLSKSLI
jgi:aspartyl/asparaginyl beta-hydroxylase (cupin superfamily)